MWLENINKREIVLASKSPRRKELLEKMGVTFEVITKSVDEIFPNNLAPANVAEYLSKLKMNAFDLEIKQGKTVITCDTTVVIDKEVLNKPKSSTEAKRMLSKLSGNQHSVFTGVSIKNREFHVSFTDETKVTFENISAAEIDYYIEQYQPFDKAGSYGIQEWIGLVGIKKIDGSYFTVMGLPTHRLRAYFETLFA
jgi:septum formation protein